MNSSLSSRLQKITQSESYKLKEAHHRGMILLAEKIYGRRLDLGLNQTELAKKANTTQRIISQLENAEYALEEGISEELYDKLADALDIDRDYLFSEKIDRKTFELYSFIFQKLNWQYDRMQLMKLPYFVDLEIVANHGFQLSNFQYIRYTYGPFDKKMYMYEHLFEQAKFEVKFSYINDFLSDIEKALEKLPITNSDKLKKLSYETSPMKKLKATLGGKEHWEEPLTLITK